MFSETRELTWSTGLAPPRKGSTPLGEESPQSFRLKTAWTELGQSRKGTRPSHDPVRHHTHTYHLRVLLAFHSAVPMTLVHLELNLYSERRKRMRTGPAQRSAVHTETTSQQGALRLHHCTHYHYPGRPKHTCLPHSLPLRKQPGLRKHWPRDKCRGGQRASGQPRVPEQSRSCTPEHMPTQSSCVLLQGQDQPPTPVRALKTVPLLREHTRG